jgi:phenylacetate-CoA ligase
MRHFALQLYEKTTGRKILSRINELNQTQWLSNDGLLALQQKKLHMVIEYAYQFVPYYQRIFKQVGFHPTDLIKEPGCFSKLPILTKAIIRENFNELITTDSERRKQMNKLATSGSTGRPLIFMQDSDFRDYVTADIQRHVSWAGCELGEPHAFIWGAGKKMNFLKKTRTKIIDIIWNRFLTDAFIMTDETLSSFTKRISNKKPKILFGYATAIYRFAQFIRTNQYRNITFEGVITTSETILEPVRQYIEETFQCKVFNRYGTLELGGVACECEEHTGLHISMENNYVEILKNCSPAKPGEVGEIIVTNLNNFGMPFIRYSIEDAAAWHRGGNCACGRESQMIEMVEGRLVDSFQTRDGRSVWAGFAGAGFRCLTHPTIKQFQVVQKSLDRMIVRLVKNENIPADILEEIATVIQTTFGQDIVVDFEFPDHILPLQSGKHQYAVSELNK